MSKQLADINFNLQDLAQKKGIPGANQADPDKGFTTLLGSLMQAVMVIASLLLLVNLLWGAIDWISAAGDKSKLEKARSKIVSSIIGIIVLSASAAIFMLVQKMLGLDILAF